MDETAKSSVASKATGKKKIFRADIQGLRAFAVIFVVCNHLLDWPRGGFVGVDIFFVISGFVITEGLFREQSRSGRISIREFYLRRIKRIVPASTLVLVVTIVLSYLMFGPSRFRSVLWDSLSAVLFTANWHFGMIGTDYFAQDGPVSPIQHYWSLSIEEQFYFIWPGMLAAIFWLCCRKGFDNRIARVVSGITVALIVLLSFLWAVRETARVPSLAYFSSASRFWELGLGVFLSIMSPLLTKLPRKIRPILAWFGLFGMVAALFIVDATHYFPAPMAAVPVFSVALVIIADTGYDRQGFLFPLTNPISQYIGNISYSWYLWHFPLIVFAAGFFDLSFIGVLSVFLGSFVMAAFSYHLVEDPIRKSGWLTGRRPADAGLRRGKLGRKIFAGIAGLVAMSVLFSGVVLFPKSSAQSQASNQSAYVNTSIFGSKGSGHSPELLGLQREIAGAISATAWPELSPTMDEAIAGPQVESKYKSCGTDKSLQVTKCTFGPADAKRSAVLMGDSISMTYSPILDSIVKAHPGWNLKIFGVFGCSFTASLVSQPGALDYCSSRKNQAVQEIIKEKPSIVVISNTYDPRFDRRAKAIMTPTEWGISTKKYIDRFKSSVGKIVLLAPPPSDINIQKCYTPVKHPADCMSHLNEHWVQTAQQERKMAIALKATYIDSIPWFCDAHGQCPTFVGRIPTKKDHVHMTPAYAHRIAPVVSELFESLQIFTP